MRSLMVAKFAHFYLCIVGMSLLTCILIDNIDCRAFVVQAFRMPPWVAEVIKVLWWGSSTGWFGLSCPAHCSSSLPLLLSVFVAGFSTGALSLLFFLWTYRQVFLQPVDFAPPLSRRSPSSRLAGYLHERAARPH